MLGILDILYLIFIKPLQLIFETIYMITDSVICDPGLSIIALSLIMNILVLPLYMRADAMQEHERIMEQRLRKGVAHIKKTFKGDEKMMMLQTYYRQNDYKPTDVFKGSVSLFLEIPFFIAAYIFLSNLALLQGVSFGPIADLSKPDGLLQFGDVTLNLLPFIMTAINLVSCIIFTRGSSVKQKIQLYGMALFFLIFLYGSPSGLVFYWTLNNVFALCKTIVYKIVDAVRTRKKGNAETVASAPKAAKHAARRAALWEPNNKLYFAGALMLTVLIGLFIPATVIGSSPQEFIDEFSALHPIWYIANSLCIAVGMFMVWMSVFYWLANKRAKVIFEAVVWIFCGIALVSFFAFGNTLGTLTNTLVYDLGMNFETGELLVNSLVLVGVGAALGLLFRFARKAVPWALAACAVALVGVSVPAINDINTAVAEQMAIQNENAKSDDQLSIPLSRTGKNVVVLMMDRAMASYIPYYLAEKPELARMYDGFTYYSNVVSYGGHTNLAIPALYGGYEYTPYEMNLRNTEKNVIKHNESLLVMPVLFSQNGFRTTVIDPTYSNYSWAVNTRAFNDYPEINAYVTDGTLSTNESSGQSLKTNLRNCFCFGFMKCMPFIVQPVLYAEGTYNDSSLFSGANDTEVASDEASDTSTQESTSYRETFQQAYNVLSSLPAYTTITNEDVNTYMIMSNIATHEITYQQEPDYVPATYVDNTAYEAAHSDRYTINGITLQMQNNPTGMMTYQTDMACLLKIGEWLEYLRQHEIYDNTRIIIVGDHGFYNHTIKEMEIDGSDTYDLERFYPLLMVKDFDATGFTTSDEFMTNADTATLSVEGLIDNPINPFTGKEINSDAKEETIYVTTSFSYSTTTNNGTTFINDMPWLVFNKNISSNMRNPKSWTIKNLNF